MIATSFDFPGLLRRARLEAGLTQDLAAVRLGVTQPLLSQYEHGKVTPPLARMTELLTLLGWRLSGERIEATPGVRSVTLGSNDAFRLDWTPRMGSLLILGPGSLAREYLSRLSGYPPQAYPETTVEVEVALRGEEPSTVLVENIREIDVPAEVVFVRLLPQERLNAEVGHFRCKGLAWPSQRPGVRLP